MVTTEPAPDLPTSSGLGRKDSTYQQIKESILEGRLQPGSLLVEVQLAESCGVSRTPVREALTRLQQDGLVERGERGGLVVRQRSPEQILDIYDVRIVLEGTVARFAAERYHSYDKVLLERVLRASDGIDTTDHGELVRANLAFHETVWKASHNDAILDVLSRLDLHLGRYPATTLSHPGRWEEAVAEHRGIAEAIVARDPDLADQLARKHFTAARDLRLELLEHDTY